MYRIFLLFTAVTTSAGLLVASDSAVRTLSIHDAIRSALENNLQLQVEDLSPSIAIEGLRQARSEFDPVFSIEGSYEEIERRQNTIEFLSTGQVVPGRIFEEQSALLRTGVAKRTALGTTFDLHTRVRRVENSVLRESPTAIFRPEYETFAGIQVTQPLLQGFGPDANLAGVRAARLGLSIAEAEREITVVNAVSEVVNVYYDMVFGQEDLLVKRESLDVANELLRENLRRLELGRMAPIDVAEARVRVSETEEELIRAEDFLRERELMLRRLIYDRTDWRSEDRLRVVVDLPELIVVPEDTKFLFDGALDLRPDYRLALREYSRERLREDFSTNQALPQLDLRFSYGFSGLDGGFDTSYDRVIAGREPQWAAGFIFSIPIGNREGRARISSARKMRRQAELEIQRIEHDIAIDLQNSVARLVAIDQRLRTSRESLRLAEEALRLEEGRLEAGLTTSYRVMELQTAMSSAQTREVAARVEAQKATAQVWAVSGRLLMEHGFHLSEAVPRHQVDTSGVRWNKGPVRWGWSEETDGNY
ncbi:MAG: TolC family protein [Opitutales bacterium]